MAEEFESDYDDARFGRRARNGIFMGLGWLQIILAVIVLLFAVGSFMARGFPSGAVFAALILIFGGGLIIPQFAGRSLPEWIGVHLKFLSRKSKGQLSYRRNLDQQITARVVEDETVVLPKGHYIDADGVQRDKRKRRVLSAPMKMYLPGNDDQVLVYDTPEGHAFAYDRKRRMGIVVARLSTSRAFALESKDRQVARTQAYDEALSAMGRVEGLALIGMSDQTRMLSSRNISEYYDKRISKSADREVDGEIVKSAGADIDPFLDAAYREMTESAALQSVHEQWMTLAFSESRLRTEIDENGKGIPGFVDTVSMRLESLGEVLREAGVSIDFWHDSRTFAALIRSAYDPESTLEVSERSGNFRGVEPSVAGPMAVEIEWNHLLSDSTFHRVYWVSEWPRKKAKMGFLETLVFAGDFPHTVTQILRPNATDKAMKKIESRKTDHGTTSRFREKSGRADSFAHNAELEDIELVEEEISEGHGSFDLTGIIVVSGETKAELERNCSRMRAAAASKRIELSVAYGQQDSAFSAGALPLAKGMNIGVELPW